MNRTIELFSHGIRYAIHKFFYNYHFLGKKVAIGKSVIISDPRFVSIGDYVHLQDDVWLNNLSVNKKKKISGIIEIGKHTDLGKRCFISAVKKVVIGDGVLIAPNVHIADHTHEYQDIKKPIKIQPTNGIAEVEIKTGSWIGINSVILPGVSIGKNSVIGANSVVTKSIPDYSVAVGSPARIVKRYNPKKQKWLKN